MNILIEAPFDLSASTEELVREKVGKLSTYFERIQTTTVYLRQEQHGRNPGAPDSKTVEIRLEVPRQTLYADASSDTFEKALADATQKVGRQLRKYKQQLSRH